MRAFAAMFDEIDRTTSTLGKVAAMESYFRRVGEGNDAPTPADAAWAIYVLMGRKLRRVVTTTQLWTWVLEETGLQPWLLEESYGIVGDLAETIALLVGRQPSAEPAIPEEAPLALAEWIEGRLMRLATLDPSEQRDLVRSWWRALAGEPTSLYLLTKLITGSLRVGVSQRLVVKALARVAGVDEPTIEHRLRGAAADWRPTAEWYSRLISPDPSVPSAEAPAGERGPGARDVRPYPFFLASPILETAARWQHVDAVETLERELGARGDWLAEWKWDGIRAQVIKRNGEIAIWSRGDELVTDRFPELVSAVARVGGDAVIDGELLAWRDGAPLPFHLLQKRIGRTAITPRVLREAPVAFVAYDLLERAGVDLRERPLTQRRTALVECLGSGGARLVLSPEVVAASWADLAQARSASRGRGVEGVMLKRWTSPYRTGRVRGDWWKWKIDPYSIDAVLTFAQPGHGRRANLLTDYTFGVWDDSSEHGQLFEPRPGAPRTLVTIAKAYSGLSIPEIEELDRWIRAHTIGRHGPVRAVEPVRVFELHFEGLQASDRHRAGVALRFPRIARWRTDKNPTEADTLARVKELLAGATR